MIYFTFGVGSPYAGHYVEVESGDSSEARDVMFVAHGNRWGFEYERDVFEPQIKKYNLKRLASFHKNEFGNWVAT